MGLVKAPEEKCTSWCCASRADESILGRGFCRLSDKIQAMMIIYHLKYVYSTLSRSTFETSTWRQLLQRPKPRSIPTAQRRPPSLKPSRRHQQNLMLLLTKLLTQQTPRELHLRHATTPMPLATRPRRCPGSIRCCCAPPDPRKRALWRE